MYQLSDRQLLSALESLKSREHNVTLNILCYLGEVERRKLHLTLGYGSLFDFATRHLRYSESAAGRRIQAARCIAKYPELKRLFERNEVSLSTVAIVSRILNDSNKVELLAQIRNKSQRQIEAIVATAKPAMRVRDRVKPIMVAATSALDATTNPPLAGMPPPPLAETPPPLLAATSSPPLDAAPGDVQPSVCPKASAIRRDRAVVDGFGGIPASGTRAGSAGSATDHSRSGSRLSVASLETAGASEQQFKVQFAAPHTFMRKFEEARLLLSGRFPKGASFAQVFEAALDALLEKKSPTRRHEKRSQRAARRQGKQMGRVGRKRATQARDLRAHVPVAVRDAVFVRDGGRCTFVGAEGTRCESSHDLEIDHRRPRGRGGTNEINNLRLLCARHNLLEAERAYGTKWMQQFR